MKEKIVTLFICDFCNKKYQRKHAAAKHEERCNRNPINYRPCYDCRYLTKILVGAQARAIAQKNYLATMALQGASWNFKEVNI